MAAGKRYYWMKLKESFMTSDTIDYFMSQPGGANYVVLYQMLCLKTINTDGRLSRQIGEIIIPYDIPKIKRDLKWFSEDTIRVALELFKAVGLVYEDVDGTLVLTDHENLVGSETDTAARMRKSRSRSSLPPGNTGVTSASQSAHNVTPDIEIEIRDRDKSIEIDGRDKKEEKKIRRREDHNHTVDGKASSCAESQSASAPPAIVLLLNDKSEYPIFQEAVDKWAELYPAVNIMQELRKMAGWLDANPKRRKTKQGILRFVNAWLSKAQDQGGSSGYRGGGQKKGSAADALDVLQQIHEEG